MSISQYYPGQTPVYMGLSTDTMPTNAPPGSKFVVTDTSPPQVWLLLNTGTWTQIGVLSSTADLAPAAII